MSSSRFGPLEDDAIYRATKDAHPFGDLPEHYNSKRPVLALATVMIETDCLARGDEVKVWYRAGKYVNVERCSDGALVGAVHVERLERKEIGNA